MRICKKKFTAVFLYMILLGQHIKILGSVFDNIITNHQLADGFGSQFHEIVATVIYAELMNKKYVYTPLKLMEHNYTNDSDFITKKEQLINFIDNFEINKDKNIPTQPSCFKKFFDENIVQCAHSDLLKRIKQLFRANKNIENYFNKQNFNIVVHIRRHNQHDNRINGCDIPDSLFLGVINKLRTLNHSKNPLFHIHSQGKIEAFTIFNAPDIILHLDESVENSFAAMVFANVLVISPSSFSYIAGVLSEGSVYYIPFWHNPLPHWISVNEL